MYSQVRPSRLHLHQPVTRGQTEHFDLSKNLLQQTICSVEVNAGAVYGALKPSLSGILG